MGGIAAMRYALRHPERLRSLLLMDTGAEATPSEAAAFMRGGMELARQGGMAAVYAAIDPYLGEGEAADATRARMRASYDAMDPVAFCELGEELLTHESVLPQLAALDLPTTVLVGEHDTGLRGASDDLAATIPGAVLEVIAGAAHSPQLEAREAWLAVVQGHLARRR
jgi:pimeloyl-ACP methyl ester carboxylesterase